MDYYNILNFKKEPFSNSPEPEFLFQLPQQTSCLQKLELAVRLRRGINVVIGDIWRRQNHFVQETYPEFLFCYGRFCRN